MAQLLPNGRQQFLDANGNPLVGGLVYFYIPNTTTPKDTWQDAAKSALNTNPVVCDARGQATIYGEGDYRQILQDAQGNQIWDKAVASPATVLDLQSGSYTTANDTGAANAYIIALSPAPAALTPGMQVAIRNISANNTGASTLNVNSLGALPIQGAGGNALQGGELVAGYDAVLMLNPDKTAWVLINTTGGSLPVVDATQSHQAVALGQFQTSGNMVLTLPNDVVLIQGTLATTTNSGGGGVIVYPITFAVAPYPMACLGDNGFFGDVAIISSQVSQGSFGFQVPGASNLTLRINYAVMGVPL